MFKRVPGTKDILPSESSLWQKIEEITRNTFRLYNFQEIRTPLIEEESLFNRSLGKATEIVQKQMFIIKNKEDNYCLRPEATASVVRAYIENNIDKTSTFSKFYYIGPMFRLERPQKGRLRQFHHIGCEVIGSSEPALDAEVISLADTLLRDFSISGYKIKINSLGCSLDKKRLGAILQKALKEKLGKLCANCKNRFKGNPLRILDCKNGPCREEIAGLDIRDEHLCQDCKDHFTKVKASLDSLNVSYENSPRLVRGLDYYTGTVFEISHDGLGAQDALGAGGRYNNLVKELGGSDLGAIGFAFGVERLLLVQSPQATVRSNDLVYLISLGEEAKEEGIKILNTLRKNNIAADTDYEGKSLKGAMRLANDLKAKFVLIIGEDELKKGVVTLKNMRSGEQKEIKQDKLIEELKC
ncbi:MAG: histidine--tRNA ligase [Candidatus Omnitrophica bacterium]|nr:histidine--tRNA ligase [Candidatus Omnitrophota bacterium]